MVIDHSSVRYQSRVVCEQGCSSLTSPLPARRNYREEPFRSASSYHRCRYFTPAQNPPAGTALSPQPDGKPIPKVFQPLKIRGVEFHNRIFLSPLCQYSAENGKLSPWHLAHLGGILTRGPGLILVEASAVEPQGRITPEDSGLWSDDQIPPLRQIVEFAHSQGIKIGIQLAHAGRKASTVAPWLRLNPGAVAPVELGGWPDDVWAPSAIPYDAVHAQPKELTKERIKEVVRAFVDATKRALKAGFDVIEIHNAHGYLLHEFLSPISNKRTDEYSGSFENRIRLTLEIVDAVRAVLPEDKPLFLRISGTDWLEETLPNEPSWTLADTVKLAGILKEHGVDLLDVSSAGSHPAQKPRHEHKAFQAPLSKAVKEVHGVNTPTGLLVSAVGLITTGKLAEELLEQGYSDAVFVGRQFQKEPGTVWQFAEQLGIEIKVANQIEWGFRTLGRSHRNQNTASETKN